MGVCNRDDAEKILWSFVLARKEDRFVESPKYMDSMVLNGDPRDGSFGWLFRARTTLDGPKYYLVFRDHDVQVFSSRPPAKMKSTGVW
ncbi:hypothetical protein ACFL13_02110 [Patescibacteria group bacterium]